MISIDHTVLSTQIVDIIQRCFYFCKSNCKLIPKSKKSFRGEAYASQKKITITFYRNRFGEIDRMLIAFSPHLEFNQGIHNANNVPFRNLTTVMENVLVGLNIFKTEFAYFKISSIEIGINFVVRRNAYLILNCSLMWGKYFFEKNKHEHYLTAQSKEKKNKYCKIKFYIKSEQKIDRSSFTNFELGYCEINTMRFEIKIERVDKMERFKISDLQILFSEHTEDYLKKFLHEEFKKLFLFDSKSVDEDKLKSKPMRRNFYQSTSRNYWRGLDTRERGIKIKYYNEKIPKLYNLKEELLIDFPLKF